MIERYTLPEIADIWHDNAKWGRVLEVELAVADVLAEDGIIPTEAAKEMRKRAGFDLNKINEYEATYRHDVIAFLTSVGDSLGEYKRYLHLGLTSYDVVDTALSVALVRAGRLVLIQLEKLENVLSEQAQKHRNTLMPGRTHGVHAEPTTFGWKICGWIAEAQRDIKRLKNAIETVRVGKLSGAVGTYPTINPDQEKRICDILGLEADPVSTQVISRDRHAEFISTLALIGGLTERIALEVRLLQHSEVNELMEPFKSGQRGSSAMPHKKNPVVTENICGLARLMRSWVGAAYENMPLWHERDISHSSVERVILPDATITAYYLLTKTIWVAEGWCVNADKMIENVKHDNGLMASGQILTALKMAGINDNDIYKRVQQHAMASRDDGEPLYDKVKKDQAIIDAIGDRLDELFQEESVFNRTHIPLERVGIKA